MYSRGADHSRFSHSIGVMHTARLMLDRIDRLGGLNMSAEDRTVALAAALVHDVGHGPFSHTFENVLKAGGVTEKHEHRTREIILDTGTGVGKLLDDHPIPDMAQCGGWRGSARKQRSTNSPVPPGRTRRIALAGRALASESLGGGVNDMPRGFVRISRGAPNHSP